jgi:Xaa-Pro dipeptidase
MNLELMGNARRYQVTMARSICFGEPAAELRSLESVVLEGIEQVMDFIEPGVTCEEVEGIWRKCIGKYGVEKESRCGYSQGIAFPPTGGELTASFRPGDKTVLQPNTVMHFLPAIWSTEQSLTISEPIRVTESGCERLSKFPRKLIVKDNDGSRAGSGCA